MAKWLRSALKKARGILGENSQQVECQICTSMYPMDRKHFAKVKGCKHEQKVCLSCLDQYIGQQINVMGHIQEIRCPITTCNHIYSHGEIRKVAQEKTFQRYDHLLTMKILASMKEFRWCKAEGCGYGQVHDAGEAYPIVKCHKCKAKSCYVHEVPWHDNTTCKDFDKQQALRKKSEVATATYKKRHTKSCPNCNAAIEKTGGCDHMTCYKPAGGCGYQFCWRCLADYSDILEQGNHFHCITCTYYAPYHPSSDEDTDEDLSSDEDPEEDSLSDEDISTDSDEDTEVECRVS